MSYETLEIERLGNQWDETADLFNSMSDQKWNREFLIWTMKKITFTDFR